MAEEKQESQSPAQTILGMIKNRDWLSLVLVFGLGGYTILPKKTEAEIDFDKQNKLIEDLNKRMEVYERERSDSDTFKRTAIQLVANLMADVEKYKKEAASAKDEASRAKTEAMEATASALLAQDGFSACYKRLRSVEAKVDNADPPSKN